MTSIKKITCPVCHHILWVNENDQVIKHERSKRRPQRSLDRLIQQEKEKREKFDETFLSARELERRKKKEAEDIFRNALKNQENEKK
jgi:hypothetical protein